MLAAVEAAGVLHGNAETEVFSPAVMKAREFIERRRDWTRAHVPGPRGP